ncbi:uncharacterized protein H6S33_006641 [Morchella sextelata]|uniref:uncharacterized protein n=1 Tax=Morchella sextelata TaxID=1174677 RepID=UPI001D054F87|nr:uncharacterized protein H6S33_006641 [Morchella sextelata]KAH0604264.1 hypothetical protein H6S33_006641 [Morchella sextelata]
MVNEGPESRLPFLLARGGERISARVRGRWSLLEVCRVDVRNESVDKKCDQALVNSLLGWRVVGRKLSVRRSLWFKNKREGRSRTRIIQAACGIEQTKTRLESLGMKHLLSPLPTWPPVKKADAGVGSIGSGSGVADGV